MAQDGLEARMRSEGSGEVSGKGAGGQVLDARASDQWMKVAGDSQPQLSASEEPHDVSKGLRAPATGDPSGPKHRSFAPAGGSQPGKPESGQKTSSDEPVKETRWTLATQTKWGQEEGAGTMGDRTSRRRSAGRKSQEDAEKRRQRAKKRGSRAAALVAAGVVEEGNEEDEAKNRVEALGVAAKRGNIADIQRLLSEGADPNACDSNGLTPLHRAARYGHLEATVALLDAGADPNARDPTGGAPLHWCAHRGHPQVVSVLLERGARPECTDTILRTPLHDAAMRGHLQVVQMLLAAGADEGARDFEGRSSLELAQTDAIRMLLAQVHSPKRVERDPGLALGYAATAGDNHEVCRLLLEGADVNVKDSFGLTPLHKAARFGHPQVVQSLLENGAQREARDALGATPLHWASYRGHFPCVTLLLARGADVEARDDLGRTPLHGAALMDHSHVVTALLAAGATRNAEDGEGRTSLELARSETVRQLLCRPPDAVLGQKLDEGEKERALGRAAASGNEDQLRQLLTAGTRPDRSDEEGLTPLHLAARTGQAGCAKELLKSGMDPDPRDKRQSTPLHHAARGGFEDVVVVLLQGGASPHSKDFDGNTPYDVASTEPVRLLLRAEGATQAEGVEQGQRPERLPTQQEALCAAAAAGDVAAVEALMAAGADANAAATFQLLPLHHAARFGARDAAAALLKCGADVDGRDVGGATALHWASVGGQASTASLLLRSGADPSACDRRQRTPLHDAAVGGHAQVVRRLLANGASPDARDEDGRTPLDVSVPGEARRLLEAALQGRPCSSMPHRRCSAQTPPAPSQPSSSRTTPPCTPRLHAVSPSTSRYAQPSPPPCPPPSPAPCPQPNPALCSPTCPPTNATSPRRPGESAAQQTASAPTFESVPEPLKPPCQLEAPKNAPCNPPMRAGASGHAVAAVEALCQAAREGEAGAVRRLVAAAGNADALNSFGLSALHTAARYGRLEALNALLQAGADPNVPDADGASALHWAACLGHGACAALLLRRGARVDARDALGTTPLHDAARCGHVHVLAALLAAGADTEAKDAAGRTPAQLAARGPVRDMLRQVEGGEMTFCPGTPGVCDGLEGQAPSEGASSSPRWTVSSTIRPEPFFSPEAPSGGGGLSVGVEGRCKDISSEQAGMSLAPNRCQFASYQVSVRHKPLYKPTSARAIVNEEALVTAKVHDARAKDPADQDALDAALEAALAPTRPHTAPEKITPRDSRRVQRTWSATPDAARYDPSGVGEGGKRGVSPPELQQAPLRPSHRWTPGPCDTDALCAAARSNDAQEVAKVCAAGADVNAANRFGLTALHRAARFGNTVAAQALLQRGAKADSRDRAGATPLHWAACFGHAPLVSLLLHWGAQVDARNALGKTPLHCAALFGRSEATRALLASGADPGARDMAANTPADVARNHSLLSLLTRYHKE